MRVAVAVEAGCALPGYQHRTVDEGATENLRRNRVENWSGNDRAK